MSDLQSISDRVKFYRDSKGYTPKAFERLCGLSNAYLDKTENVGTKILERILTACPDLNRDWVVRNEGKMLKEEGEIINLHLMYVPMVSQYAYAGYLSGFADPEYIEQLPKIPFVVDQENHKGSYVCFEVKGDSMNNGTEESILEGDKLLCRELRIDHWGCKLHYKKWDFVLVHRTDGILIKRIIKHEVDSGNITIHSLNDMYEDRTINLDDVSQLFNVVEVSRSRRR